MKVKAYYLVPTGNYRVSLRTYNNNSDGCCKGGKLSYHNAQVVIHDNIPDVDSNAFKHDPRFPNYCHCGFGFDPANPDTCKQVFKEALYTRSDTGAITTLDDAPPGGIWDVTYHHDIPEWCGPDGKSLYAICPDGHHWFIDGRATNCDSPCANCGKPYHAHARLTYAKLQAMCPKGYQDAKPHKCWVRYGVPPLLTVGKDGVTCGAGAGSILTPKWHGFLRDGYFETCP